MFLVKHKMNNLVSLPDRLREERRKMGLNQTDFAGIGGVTKKTQMLYEKGGGNPNSAYLSATAAAGADVLYILTGQRMPISDLSREEECLVDNYRNSPPEGRKSLDSVSAALAQPERKRGSG